MILTYLGHCLLEPVPRTFKHTTGPNQAHSSNDKDLESGIIDINFNVKYYGFRLHLTFESVKMSEYLQQSD